MSSGTTSIDQLPSAPSNPPATPIQNNLPPQSVPNPEINTENVKIENYGQQLNAERQQQNGSQVPPIDYTSQLSSALKEAQASGATVLPSRDIPQQTLTMQHDYQTKPDYVPSSETNDYIGNILNKEKIPYLFLNPKIKEFILVGEKENKQHLKTNLKSYGTKHC